MYTHEADGSPRDLGNDGWQQKRNGDLCAHQGRAITNGGDWKRESKRQTQGGEQYV